jgi:hypothetical protein
MDPLSLLCRLAASVWEELLERGFSLDVLRCPTCGGGMKLLALVTDLAQVRRFLRGIASPPSRSRGSRREGPLWTHYVLLRTVLSGTTPDGQTVTAPSFPFTLVACRRCLISYDTDTGATPKPNCFGRASSKPASACFYGQDVPVDCHACSTDPVCACGEAGMQGGC